MNEYCYVSATDGEEKRVYWDNELHVLPAGEKKLLPRFLGEHFAIRYNQGKPEPQIAVEPYDGQVAVVEAGFAPQVFRDDETGIEANSLAELLEKVKAAAIAGVTGGNGEAGQDGQTETKPQPTIAELHAALKEKGIEFRASMRKDELVALLAAADPPAGE